jgi:molecular chaperone GrpE
VDELNCEEVKDWKDAEEGRDIKEEMSGREENLASSSSDEHEEETAAGENPEEKPVEEPPAEGHNVQELKALVEKLEQEKAELVNLTQRVQADFDNFRRRTRGEKEELIKYASEGVITKLLPVLDNFERALAALQDKGEDKSYLEGVEMIYRQLYQVLTNEGLEAVPSIGCPFDPNCHEAVMQVESDGAPHDTVLEEFQKGYRLKGKLIRPSMVKVAK